MDKIDFKNLPSQETPLSAENLNLLQSNIENTMERNITADYRQGVFELGDVRIEYGLIENMNIPASSFETYTVNFSKAFSEVPGVFLQENGNYNIKCDMASSTLSGFTVNARSNDGNARTGRACGWIAIGKN